MKVVCIKECTYTFNKLDYHFNIGDQFKLSYLQPQNAFGLTGVIITADSFGNYQTYSPGDKISIVIDFTDGKSYDVTVLKSDFITLEQWRDNQLNQILS